MAVLKEGTPLKRGTFVIASLLGRGGFGEVYLARQPRMDRDVAIKVLNPHLSDDAGVVERFQREALAAASLRHPHVLPVFDFDFDEEAGVWFLAMQYIPGGRTLKERLGAPMAPEEVVRLLAGVAGALDAAHARGIVHRDVKPANVLMDGEHPELADFGIAHLGDLTGITATGMAIGTPIYMSPEQAMGKAVGPAADQYSLAVMAFEMLAGRPPFLGDSMALVMQHVNAVPPTVSAYNPAAATAAAAVARALSKNPAERFPTCVEFVQAIAPGMALFVTPSGLSAPVSGGFANASGEVGASAAVAADSTVLADGYRSAATAAQDSQIEALRKAEVERRSPALPRPALAGGGAALLVGLIAIVVAIRVMAPGTGAGLTSGSGTVAASGSGAEAMAAPAVSNTPVVALAPPGRPTGQLRVDSNPSGAVILLDGQPQARTPLGFNLVPGEYELTLQMPSYEDYVTTIDVVEGQSQTISPSLTPKPPAEVLEVASTAIDRDPYKDAFNILRIQTPTDTFRIQDDVNAVVYVRPRSKDIRDVPFTMSVRWYPAGSRTPVEASKPYLVPKDSDEEYLHVCAPASRLDPQASNQPLTVEILADGQVLSSFTFRVNGGSVGAIPPSPCDETTIRGPIASVPASLPVLIAG